MKKIISIALLGATTSLMAMYGESAYLYKDPRIMGMGGANVAVGGFSTSIFSNPAGLASIKKEHGIVVDLLGLGMSISGESLQDMADDIDAAETDDEMTQLLSDFSGTNFHVGIDNYTAISKNSDAFAWTIGALGAADSNESTARLTPSSTEKSSAGVRGVASAWFIRVSSVVSRTSKLKALFLFTILSFPREMCQV